MKKTQTADQTLKGAVAALVVYVAMKLGADTELTLLLTPIVTGVLAFFSKKVGDPTVASFFDEDY